MSTKKAAEFVAAGAAFLDSKSCGVQGCGIKTCSSSGVPGNWRTVLINNLDKFNIDDSYSCVLGTLFDDYFVGKEELGLSSNQSEGYGFCDSLNASNGELNDAWKKYLNPDVKASMDTEVKLVPKVGMTLRGKWSKVAGLKLVDFATVDDVTYFVAISGRIESNKFVSNDNTPRLVRYPDAVEDWDEFVPVTFTAKQGDLIRSAKADKVWFVGENGKVWTLKANAPTLWTGLSSLIAETPDLEHVKRGSGSKLVNDN